jgi:dihydrofolate reductase
MAKVLYSVTMSLDGFIAGPGGDQSWMTEYLGPNPEIDELIGRIGALLVGRRTYDGDDPHKGDEGEGKAFGGGWEGPQFVVTHDIPATAPPNTIFVDDFGTALAQAKEAAGDKYVNVMGASIGKQCLEAGQLDEVLTLIAPVLLGDGVPLFNHPGGRNTKLQRLSVGQVPLATSLWFKVV